MSNGFYQLFLVWLIPGCPPLGGLSGGRALFFSVSISVNSDQLTVKISGNLPVGLKGCFVDREELRVAGRNLKPPLSS